MASPSRVNSSNVARLRSLLPAGAYLQLMHQAAMTGYMPRYDSQGKPTNQFDNLSPQERLNIARYLVDKVLPDAPKELALSVATGDVQDAQALRLARTEELRALAYPETQDAEASPLARSAPAAPTDLAVPAESP